MTATEIGSLSIFYAGLCAGLALFAMVLVFLRSRNIWSYCKAKGVLGIQWLLEHSFWVMCLILIASLIAMAIAFQEPPRAKQPETPEAGRYLLANGATRIAEFNSKSDCQFAKSNFQGIYVLGRNLSERLTCVYLGKGEAKA